MHRRDNKNRGETKKAQPVKILSDEKKEVSQNPEHKPIQQTKLLSEHLEICFEDVLKVIILVCHHLTFIKILTEQPDFLVVGVLGKQGNLCRYCYLLERSRKIYYTFLFIQK